MLKGETEIGIFKILVHSCLNYSYLQKVVIIGFFWEMDVWILAVDNNFLEIFNMKFFCKLQARLLIEK